MSRRFIGERVAVTIKGCPTRDGILISGIKKPSKLNLNFPVRFPNGDVRTYRGDQLRLRGSQAPLLEYVRVGDIIFTKKTLGVVRFIGLHEDFVGPVIVLEPIDPKLPSDPDVASFRKLFPSANLTDRRTYNIIRKVEEILKILPPDALLQQLSKIKDKYLNFVEETYERDRAFEEDMRKRTKRITELENDITEQEKEMKTADESETGPVPTEKNEDANQTCIVFNPGKLGIKAVWETGEVEGISTVGQAKDLDVQIGWMIVKIDEEDYSEQALDRKKEGDSEYTLTFTIPAVTSVKDPDVNTEPEPPVEPSRAEKNPDIIEILITETEREKYERTIHELTDNIEDFQYSIQSLQAKNKKLEEEHEELPKLYIKVDHLRNSKTMFIGKIKEVQKLEKEWKQKMEENEQKYNKLLAELNSGDNVQSKNIEDSPKKEKDSEAGKPNARGSVRHRRKASVSMPQPPSDNTLSIGSQPNPQVGDGSAQKISMTSLNNNSDGNNSSGKNNRNKPKKRFPW